MADAPFGARSRGCFYCSRARRLRLAVSEKQLDARASFKLYSWPCYKRTGGSAKPWRSAGGLLFTRAVLGPVMSPHDHHVSIVRTPVPLGGASSVGQHYRELRA